MGVATLLAGCALASAGGQDVLVEVWLAIGLLQALRLAAFAYRFWGDGPLVEASVSASVDASQSDTR